MRDLLFKLCSAIATAEGWWDPNPNARPKRNNNPGNLTASPLERPKDPRFVKFLTPQEGIAALYNQVARHILRGYTLRQFITAWAPPHENDTENYVRETARRVGLELKPNDKGVPDTEPLYNYLVIERLP